MPLPPRAWSEFYPDAGQKISTRTSRSDICYDGNGPKSGPLPVIYPLEIFGTKRSVATSKVSL